MDQTFKPIVITSRAADKDLNKIRVRHEDLLNSIQNQAIKVEQYNAQKNAEKQMLSEQNASREMESQKSQMDADNKRMELENKQQELAIKAQALL